MPLIFVSRFPANAASQQQQQQLGGNFVPTGRRSAAASGRELHAAAAASAAAAAASMNDQERLNLFEKVKANNIRKFGGTVIRLMVTRLKTPIIIIFSRSHTNAVSAE